MIKVLVWHHEAPGSTVIGAIEYFHVYSENIEDKSGYHRPLAGSSQRRRKLQNPEKIPPPGDKKKESDAAHKKFRSVKK